MKPLVLVDTNVFISGALTTGRAPDSVLEAWLADRFALVVPATQFTELGDVLTRPKFGGRLGAGRIDGPGLLEMLHTQSAVVPDRRPLIPVCARPR